MSLAEILPDVQSLPRADKLRLIQILTQEMADAEGATALAPGAKHAGWCLDPDYRAAATLLEFFSEFDVCFFRARQVFEVRPARRA